MKLLTFIILFIFNVLHIDSNSSKRLIYDINDNYDNKVNTVCLFADKEFQFISSSVVKEVFSLGKDISSYVDERVERKLIMKRGN